MSANCGREACLGKACGNFEPPEKGGHGCKGVDWSKQPWNCGEPKPSTAERSIREQDVIEAADALAMGVANYREDFCFDKCCRSGRECTNCVMNKLVAMAEKYRKAREGLSK